MIVYFLLSDDYDDRAEYGLAINFLEKLATRHPSKVEMDKRFTTYV